VPLTVEARQLVLFENLCRRFDATGDLAPDAYLAALAVGHGCELASLDRDFSRFEQLRWRVPGQQDGLTPPGTTATSCRLRR
jgi:predicted nucleic acid-binding protein